MRMYILRNGFGPLALPIFVFAQPTRHNETMARCVFVCMLLPLFLPALCRRNLSTIRYHFTTCGTTGRDGPSYETCRQHYESIDSPLLRDGVFTSAHGENFFGSQSFRPPKSTVYNLSIAAAAGGRGLCNVEFGRGLVVNISSTLNSSVDYLILVGQQGLGPCDADDNGDELWTLCDSPPTDLESANSCRQKYVDWLRNQSDLDYQRTLRLSGGGGGGGTSFFGLGDIRLEGDARVLCISGGGGGTSALLDYSAIDNLVPGTSHQNISLYTRFINGSTSMLDLDIADNFALRGYRVNVQPPDVTAGAGGGFFSNASFISNQQDGRPAGRTEDFATGGIQCARNDFSQIPNMLRWGDGGFGGGGGGCGGGGGGGGVTGGAVLGDGNTIPGGGGYTYVTRDAVGSWHEGDGYVDIVEADCGCVHRCEVYEEEDQFQCLCPNDTLLAPDLSDCFYTVEQDVAVYNETLVSVERYQLRLVETGNTTIIYSIAAELHSADALCAIAFLGENLTDIVAVTEPAKGTARVGTLALTTLNATDGTFAFSDYTQWLSDPQIITGALLISNGDCSLTDDLVNMTLSLKADTNDSIKEIVSVQSGDGDIALAEFLDSNQNLLRDFITAVLQIRRPAAKDRSSLLSMLETVLVIVGGALLGLCSCVFFVGTIWCYGRRQRNKMGEWPPPQNAARHSNVSGSVSTLLSNHAYGRYSSCIPTRSAQVIAPVQTPSSVHSDPQHEYEILSYSEDELKVSRPSVNSPVPASLPIQSAWSNLREAVFESSVLLSPKFGHSAPFHNFVGYNRSRTNSSVREWQFPRSNLVYLRELGEGQFGKVLLMKTQGIAGYQGSIPVAVKTLSSQEPDIIEKFLEEAELMKKFSHPNIVSILGVCTDDVDETSAPLMILEYMPFGDLLSFLQKYKPAAKNAKWVVQQEHFFCFAIDVARAMEFLANSKFVHRDIAARNCLVGTNLVVKIADFGLTRGVHDKDYYRVAGTQILPIRAMSPESLLYGVFTIASDVWSYGVLLWEIVTYGEVPLMGMSTEDMLQAAHNQTLLHNPPAETPPVLSSLIAQCHHYDSDQRPSFTFILSQLPS